jgi:hypothetical protein
LSMTEPSRDFLSLASISCHHGVMSLGCRDMSSIHPMGSREVLPLLDPVSHQTPL